MQTSLPNLVVFYLETTGFTPDRHEIIQIAAVARSHRVGPVAQGQAARCYFLICIN